MNIIKAKIYEVVPFETKPDILDNWYVIYYGSDIPVTAWYDSELGWQLDHDEKLIPTHWLKPLPSEKKYTEEERDRFAIGFFIDAIHKYKMEYVRLKGWHQTDINPDKYYNHQELLDFYKRDLTSKQ